MHLLGRCASDVDATQHEGRPAFQQLNPHDWAEHASVQTCLPPTLITNERLFPLQPQCQHRASRDQAPRARGRGRVACDARVWLHRTRCVGVAGNLPSCLAIPRARPRGGRGLAPSPRLPPVGRTPRRAGSASAASEARRWGSRPHGPRSDALPARGEPDRARQPAVQRHHPGPLAAPRRALPRPRVALGQSASQGQIGAQRGPRSAEPLGLGASACGVTAV